MSRRKRGSSQGKTPRGSWRQKSRLKVRQVKKVRRVETLSALLAKWRTETPPTKPPRLCEVDGCDNPHHARGRCSKHYQWERNRARGQPMRGNPAERGCDIDDCDRPHKARGLCRRHYEVWRRHAAPGPKCGACDRPAIARGWCNTHYRRVQRTGTTERIRPPETCTVDDCDRPHKAKGWCGMHYQRWARHGDLKWRPMGGVREGHRRRQPCSVDGCETLSHAKGMCQKHYQRMRRHFEGGCA